MKVICITGLPGSGKTHLAKQLRITENAFLFDDIKSLADLEVLIKDNKNVIITDPNFCIKEIAENAEKIIKKFNPNVNLEWIYFENEPDKCRKNVFYRKLYKHDDREVESTISLYSKKYFIPSNITPLKIWQPNI